MVMTADDLADIKPKLEAAKKKPINFGVCVGQTPLTTVILFSKTKDGKALEKLAKKAGETNKTAFGTVFVAEGVVTLSCAEDVPSGICKKVRGLLASQKIGFKVRAVDSTGAAADIEEDAAGVSPDAGGQSQPDETQSNTTDQPDRPKPPGWDKIVATIGPRVAAFVQSGAEKAQSVASAWKAALAAADAGRADEAMIIVNKVMPLLRPIAGKPQDAPVQTAPQSGDVTGQPEPTGQPDPTAAPVQPQTTAETEPVASENVSGESAPDDRAADLVKAARLWRESVKVMRSEMQKLQTAIVAHLAPDPALAEIADDARLLSVRLDVFDLDMADTLDAAVRLAPEARDGLIDDARDDLDRYRAALDGRFFADVDQANGFATVAVAATARKSLAALDKLLA